MSDWHTEQLTRGSDQGVFHSHSYYDIHVFDSASRRVVAHRMNFAGRAPSAEDAVDVGLIDIDGDRAWQPLGRSSAWSWQQGPMAQWVPGQSKLLWNDREQDRFVTRVCDPEKGVVRTLPRPSYAVDPNGKFTLGLNMARLDTLRPGYGYVGGSGARLNERRSKDDGIWMQSLAEDQSSLLLSLRKAVGFLWSRLGWRDYIRHRRARYHYWFNHIKLSPDGRRFTVKLRYKRMDPDGGWTARQGVSLTCGVDGRGLRLLADATSHVIWYDNQSLFFWRLDGFYRYADTSPEGELLSEIAPGEIEQNAHLRYLPGAPSCFVFDTPYREDIDLMIHDENTNATRTIAKFSGHEPKNGPFRCDLHPCPSPDGNRMVVTSLADGGRQLYLLERAQA